MKTSNIWGGMSYTDNRGNIRKVLLVNPVSKKVRYKVTRVKNGNNKVKMGEEKEISLKAFALWAKMP